MTKLHSVIDKNIFDSLKEGTCFIASSKSFFIIKKIHLEPEKEIPNIHGTKQYVAQNNYMAEIFCVTTNKNIITPIQWESELKKIFFVDSSAGLQVDIITEVI